MPNIINERRFEMKKVFVVILFLVFIMVMAAPVGAKRGEDVTITVSSEYTTGLNTI